MQEIEPPEFTCGPREHHLDVRRFRDVSDDRDRLAARRGDFRRDAIRIVPVDIGDRDGAAAMRESLGRRAPDSRSGSRYETCLAFESHFSISPDDVRTCLSVDTSVHQTPGAPNGTLARFIALNVDDGNR